MYGKALKIQKDRCEYIELLLGMYPKRSSFVQHPQQKLCRDPSNKLSCYAWFHSHRNTLCSPYRFFFAAFDFFGKEAYFPLRLSLLYFVVIPPCAASFGVIERVLSVSIDVVVVWCGTFLRYCLFCATVVCRSVDTELVVVEVWYVLVFWFCSV